MRHLCRTIALVALALAAAAPALALDLNSFRAQHKLPPLAMSSTLAGAAYAHAQDMASRRRLDHKNFRRRRAVHASAAAENVAFGCATEDCVFRMWSRSAGHRRNMLLRNVSAYGLASAVAANGRRYWVLELGN
jgi:uncharacterized protein YkwD